MGADGRSTVLAAVASFTVVAAVATSGGAAGGEEPVADTTVAGPLIAYTSRVDGYDEIFSMAADGTQQTRLTFNTAISDRDPAWSPDGTEIAFASNRDGGGIEYDIYVMDADGSNVRRLTTAASLDAAPTWSPDGGRIAFESDRDANREIYVMDADGGNQTRLTDAPALDASADWSPDGTRIVWTKATYDAGTNTSVVELYTMGADGSGQTLLKTNASAGSWSPDGTKIAYANGGSPSNVHVMNADGSGSVQLTDGTFHSSPTWSPDGTRIAFTSSAGMISIMDADGSSPTALAPGYVPDFGPAPATDPGTAGEILEDLRDAAAGTNSWKSNGLSTAFASRLDDLEDLIDAGALDAAADETEALLKRVDGCGPSPDKNDWVACDAQPPIRGLLEDLLDSITT